MDEWLDERLDGWMEVCKLEVCNMKICTLKVCELARWMDGWSDG